MKRTCHNRSPRRGIRAALLGACIIVSSSHAGAQSLGWHVTTFNDGGNAGRYMANLVYGVPETDDRQVMASCAANDSSNTISALFGFDVRRMRNGQSTVLELIEDGDVIHRVRATVERARAEEGLSGIRVETDASDRLWSVLSDLPAVSYRAGRKTRAIPLGLKGSARGIREFLGKCERIFTANRSARPGRQPAPKPAVENDRDNPENDVSAVKSCRAFGSAKSQKSDMPITIRIVNNTRGYRTVMWLDYNGRPVEYRNLKAGESYEQKTFVGHPWMAVDGPGNCKQIFYPSRQSRYFDITRK